jgi:hypothetical protein
VLLIYCNLLSILLLKHFKHSVCFSPTYKRNLMLILCAKYFITHSHDELSLQLKHNSSAFTRLVKTNLLLCRIQICTYRQQHLLLTRVTLTSQVASLVI